MHLDKVSNASTVVYFQSLFIEVSIIYYCIVFLDGLALPEHGRRRSKYLHRIGRLCHSQGELGRNTTGCNV